MEGPVIVSVLGLVAGAVCHYFFRHFWVASSVATFVASALWVGGVWVFLALAAPSELAGPVAWIQILLTVLNALLAALIAGGAIRAGRVLIPVAVRHPRISE
jgi:hypothetical protein